MKSKNKFVFLFSVLFLFLVSSFSFPVITQGFEFRSDSYIIDWGNFNITSGKKNSTNYQLTDTVGQNSPGKYESDGYTLKSGFQYIYDLIYPFSFALDTLSIDLGNLTPEIGSTAVANISISSPAGHGYQVMVSQNHPLQINSTSFIPDFIGDNSLASESVSDTWDNSSTFGFGFNASGDGTAAYFASLSHYRQFANTSTNEIPQIFMSENTPQKNRSSQVTFKANISGTQAAGKYENAITFIAVPKY